MTSFARPPDLTHGLSRRSAILGLGGAVFGSGGALAVAAAPGDKRFVVVLLRGAMDGLSAVVPYGDPGLMALRPELVPPPPGQDKGMLDLDGMFALHPALTQAHAMYRANELLAVHAVAGSWRARSHFEAQDYLESGAERRLSTGWLNRTASAMKAGSAAQPRAIAIGGTMPLLLRGAAPAANWAPHGFSEPKDALYQTVLALNRDDRITGPAIASGLRARGFGHAVLGDMQRDKGRFAFPALALAAGALLRAPDGPRLAAMELGGWDTHTGQANRIVMPLSQLDSGLAALRDGLGEAWKQTVVLVMTEFGRTARMNGTNGTDHGTASVAFLAGGAIAGGRVAGNWPGLGAGRLLEDRDLAPATDLRAIAKGVLTAHLGVGAGALAAVFPGAETVPAMRGLTRAG